MVVGTGPEESRQLRGAISKEILVVMYIDSSPLIPESSQYPLEVFGINGIPRMESLGSESLWLGVGYPWV